MTSRLKEAIRIIRAEGRGYDQYVEVSHIAWKIFVARRDTRNEPEEFKFTPTPKEVAFQEFIYEWGKWFSTRKIPFEEWNGICDEGLTLTLKFIESNLEDRKDLEEYETFIKKIVQRRNDIFASDKYTEDQKMYWGGPGF